VVIIFALIAIIAAEIVRITIDRGADSFSENVVELAISSGDDA
jgi:hypothetical protein